RFLEFPESRLQVALLKGLFALFHVELSRLEAEVLSAELVFRVTGVGAEGAFVADEGGIVVLQRLGLAAGVVILICLRAAYKENRCNCPKRQICCAAQPGPPEIFHNSFGV